MNEIDIFAGHRTASGFRSPWGDDLKRPGGPEFLRWRLDRLRDGIAPDPAPAGIRTARHDIAYPSSRPGEVRLTWVGHSTVLVQLGGTNILTDPIWSRRASPIAWLGPARLVPAAVPFDELPDIHCVALSHDHYDHLDAPTVRRLQRRFGDALTWITPVGYRGWFAGRGITNVLELDWWEEGLVPGAKHPVRVRALPARHWTARNPFRPRPRLWCGFAFEGHAGERVLYAGDSGYFPEYAVIGRRAGPFDAVILPVGAYEPRWFMKPVHMNPEEAVQAWIDLGGAGTLLPVHWGTFRLSDESPIEPLERLPAAWRARGLTPELLGMVDQGATVVVSGSAAAGRIVTS